MKNIYIFVPTLKPRAMQVDLEREIQFNGLDVTYDILGEVEVSKEIGGSDDMGRYEYLKEYHTEFTTNITYIGTPKEEVKVADSVRLEINEAVKTDINENYQDIINELIDRFGE